METIQYSIDYEDAITTLIRELSTERAAQLYDFARFITCPSDDVASYGMRTDRQLHKNYHNPDVI